MNRSELAVGGNAAEPSRKLRRRRLDPDISVVIPCLNEAETLAACVAKALRFFKAYDLAGEVIVADNGSTDGSQRIAEEAGARVVHVAERGYGAALRGGIREARAPYVAIGDADESYDFMSLMPFLERLRDGCDLVIGNRFLGGIGRGAMPGLHRYFGNPVLSFLGRLLFRAPVGDFHCGLRAFRRDAILGLGLSSPGMEYASEMVVKAQLAGLRISEVPTTLAPDRRSRAPHLRSWRDGWRHLKFLLTFSPRWLYFYPGLALIILGTLGISVLLPGDRTFGSVRLGVHTLLFSAAGIIMGVQLISFGLLANIFGVRERYWPPNYMIRWPKRLLPVETACVVGGLLFVAGLATSIFAFLTWADSGYGDMDVDRLMRISIPSVTLCAVGLQAMFTAFLVALLTHPRRHDG